MSGDTLIRLENLGIIIVDGPDARSFLQGQLTADLDRLDAQRMLLAACNSPQGRVQAIVRLVQRADAIAMLLPASMIETTIARLRKYTLRAKVGLRSGAETLAAYLLPRNELPTDVRLANAGDHVESAGVSYLNWLPTSDRVLKLAANPTARADSAREAAWHLAEIRAGLPQVYPQTHESFVAQMLNLDLLDGISFEKGCYTGQEVIARTHFRGTIKRRMFHFWAACPPPAPGTRVVHEQQHAGEVVDAATSGDGCELLAVINLAQQDEALQLENGEMLRRLEMPYGVG